MQFGTKTDSIKIFLGLHFFYMHLFGRNNFGYIIGVKQIMISYISINISCFICTL